MNTASCLFVLLLSIVLMLEKKTGSIIFGSIAFVLSILGLIILPILVIIFFFKDTTFLENVLYPKYFTQLRDTSLYYLFSIFLTFYVPILHMAFCLFIGRFGIAIDSLMCLLIGFYSFFTIPLLSAIYLLFIGAFGIAGGSLMCLLIGLYSFFTIPLLSAIHLFFR